MRITLPFLLNVILSSLAILVLVWPAWPQGKGGTGLHVIVRPEAVMSVAVIAPPDFDSAGQRARWFRVDLTVRVNSGATANLFLEDGAIVAGAPGKEKSGRTYFVQSPGSTSAERWDIAGSRPLFTTRRNGSFSLLVGVGLAEPLPEARFYAERIQFVLRSSDGSFRVTRAITLNGQAGVPHDQR